MANLIRVGGGGGSTPAPTLITKSITQNGTYLAQDDNADGYSEVAVDVAGGEGNKQIAYLKWRITNTRSNPANNALQLSEFYLYLNDVLYDWDSNVSITASLSAISASESIEKIIDGNVDTKYVTIGWGGSYVGQCDIVISLGETITVDNNTTYAYVTGDDEPSRDPVGWTLFGSIDGSNWFVLDARDSASVPTARKTSTDKFSINVGSGGGSTNYIGTTTPTSSLGVNGDTYTKYTTYSYQRLNYVETNGGVSSQYVDTGRKFTPKSVVKINAYLDSAVYASWQCIFGWRDTNPSLCYYTRENGTNAIRKEQMPSSNTDMTGIYDTDIELELSATGMSITDGTNTYSASYSFTDTTANNMRLLSSGYGASNEQGKYRLYDFVWEEDNIEIIHYVPVLDDNNVPCLLNTVNGELNYSNNSSYPLLSGGSTGTTIDGVRVVQTYLKINGEWEIVDNIYPIVEVNGTIKSLLYSIDQSQGGAWINTNITASDYDKFIFINSDNGDEQYTVSIAVSDIAVYTGGTDVYTIIFSASQIGLDFNARIYNDKLYVSYNGTGASTKVVGVYEEVNSSVEFKNYLKFNGYGIILPWTLDSDYKIEVVFHETTYLQDSAIIGNTRNETRSNLTEYNNAYFTSTGTSGSGFGSWSAGEHTFITNNGNGKNEFDGVEVTDYTPTTDSTINYAIGWRATAGNAFKGWIKSYKVYSISSGDLLHELKPALVMDSPCLYDTIDGKIYSTSLVEAVDTIA